MVAPVLFEASRSSDASFSDIDLPPRARAEEISQRMASDCLRSPLISTGTWYVAPPTRLGLTSRSGVALRNARSKTSIGLRRAVLSTLSSAVYTIRSAKLFLPLTMSLFMKRVSVRLPKRGSGATSRFSTRARRGTCVVSPAFERSLLSSQPAASYLRADSRSLTAHFLRSWLYSGTEDRRALAAFVHSYLLLGGFPAFTAGSAMSWLPSGSLRGFRPILGPSLLAVFDTAGIECATHDVVSHARQVFDAAAPHEHD